MHRFFAIPSILILLLAMFGFSKTAAAQPAPAALAAQTASISSRAIFTTPGEINTLIPLSDGQVLAGGRFVSLGGQAAPQSLALISSGGSVIPSFQVDPVLQVDRIFAAARQSDGKIIIAGQFHKQPDTFTCWLLRLLPDGAIDDTFVDTTVYGQVSALLIDGDKIVVGGNFFLPSAYLARLDQNGNVDPTFNMGSGPSGKVWSIARQSSGKYILAGEFASYNGIDQAGLARLNTNGTLDGTFVPGGYMASRQVAVLKDNSVIVGSENICGDAVFAWYSPDGVLKPTLDPNPDILQSVTALSPLPDGGFLIGGWYSVGCFSGSPLSHEAQLWRFAADGSYETATFFGDESDVTALALRSDGKVILGGQGRPSAAGQVGLFNGLALVDLSNHGLEQVSSFHPLVGDEAVITSLSRYPDGRLLVSGNFSFVNGAPRFGLARLLASGFPDPGFHPFADRPNGWSNAALALPDGRAVAGFGDSNLYLIGQDGTIQTDLSALNNYDRVTAVTLQQDGKVLLGTNFGLGVRRLKADFTAVDSEFIPGDTYGDVYALAEQTDQKILVAGNFSKYNNIDAPGLVRLNADGSLDDSFQAPIFLLDEYNSATLYSLTPLAGGEMLVGGNFQTVGGTNHPALVRLGISGGLDASFNSPTGTHTVKSVCRQGDGTIWAGGIDSSISRNPLVLHLETNGQPNPDFQSSFRAAHSDGVMNSVLCQSEGLSWSGGQFSLVDDRPVYGLVSYQDYIFKFYLPQVQFSPGEDL